MMTSATKLSQVSGLLIRHTSVATAHTVISRYAPAKLTQRRLDFSGMSQASLTLQYKAGWK